MTDQVKTRHEASTGGQANSEISVGEAAVLLAKSVRSLERSLEGRWGNKLPEGWSARKVRTCGKEEWRLTPAPDFKKKVQGLFGGRQPSKEDFSSSIKQTEAQVFTAGRSSRQATVVIDHSREVENLLRELLAAQKELAEERRLHMEDLRLVTQLQGQMRLLEADLSAREQVRSELELNKRELGRLKDEYNQLVALPWWKRLIGRACKQSRPDRAESAPSQD
jgi:hypothetical protein